MDASTIEVRLENRVIIPVLSVLTQGLKGLPAFSGIARKKDYRNPEESCAIHHYGNAGYNRSCPGLGAQKESQVLLLSRRGRNRPISRMGRGVRYRYLQISGNG